MDVVEVLENGWANIYEWMQINREVSYHSMTNDDKFLQLIEY